MKHTETAVNNTISVTYWQWTHDGTFGSNSGSFQRASYQQSLFLTLLTANATLSAKTFF